MCGRVFDPGEVSETKLNPLKGRRGDRWLWTLPRRYNVPPTMPLPVMTLREGVRTIEPSQQSFTALLGHLVGRRVRLSNAF